jgi:transposase
MLDRFRVQTLGRSDLTREEIARSVDVSRRSVQRILHEPAIEGLAPTPTAKSRGVGRPSQVEAFREAVAAVLAEEPSLPTVEVLARLRLRGYTGQKSALYALVRRLRGKPKPEPPLVLFEGLAGEFSQHDFGHVDVDYADGSRERVHFFVSRLKFSRWTHVALVPDEKVEALVRALLAGFEAFGGVPLRSVFDNPKTIVVSQTAGRSGCEPAGEEEKAAAGVGGAPLLGG